MTNLFDEYSFKARLMPTFLILLPVALAAWALMQNIQLDWKFLGGIIVYCGGTFLLSQLGRDLGRRKQDHLFDLWGGKPTTRLLRHRAPKTIDPITLNRYHAKLGNLIDKTFPSKEEEAADKKVADMLYESGGKMLLEKTRDKNKFALVFQGKHKLRIPPQSLGDETGWDIHLLRGLSREPHPHFCGNFKSNGRSAVSNFKRSIFRCFSDTLDIAHHSKLGAHHSRRLRHPATCCL